MPVMAADMRGAAGPALAARPCRPFTVRALDDIHNSREADAARRSSQLIYFNFPIA